MSRRLGDGERERERERERQTDVLTNTVGEPRAARSPPHLTGSRPNLPQQLRRTVCVCVCVCVCGGVSEYVCVHLFVHAYFSSLHMAAYSHTRFVSFKMSRLTQLWCTIKGLRLLSAGLWPEYFGEWLERNALEGVTPGEPFHYLSDILHHC